jgi:hypothetical protein
MPFGSTAADLEPSYIQNHGLLSEVDPCSFKSLSNSLFQYRSPEIMYFILVHISTKSNVINGNNTSVPVCNFYAYLVADLMVKLYFSESN